jgi:hypothetical protein
MLSFWAVASAVVVGMMLAVVICGVALLFEEKRDSSQ